MNDRIQEFGSGGKFPRAFGRHGTKHGQFSDPIGLGVNKAGDIYVADSLNARVQEFGPTFKFIRQVGTFTYGGPGDLAVAPDGEVYVTDGAFIRHYSPKGVYLGSFGGTGSGPGQFTSTIGGLAVGPKGKVWASDYSGGRVEAFSASGTYVRSVADSGKAALVGAIGVGVTASALYISDNGHERDIELKPNGTYVRTFGVSGAGKLDNTAALSVDCRGNVYVSDLDVGRVREFGNPAQSRGVCP
jgi:streptogramin lyase